MEDKIPEVLAYMESIKAREATQPWYCRVLEVEESASIFCFTTDFYVSLLVEHWETLMEHGLRLACDGTHDISNSRIKLIAVGLAGAACAPSEHRNYICIAWFRFIAERKPRGGSHNS